MTEAKICAGIMLTVCLCILPGCSGSGGGSSSPGFAAAPKGNSVSSTVSTAGGTIAVSDAASPLNGFKMVIPADALTADTGITVQATSEAIPLPQTVGVSDGVIELLPAGQTFSKPVSITIPFTGNTPPTIVTYDSTSKNYSILPALNIDDTNKTITVLTTHFTLFAKVFSDINKSLDTGFTIGTDTFKINNSKDAMAGTDAYTGACWGFAYYSQWYFMNKKASGGNLYGKYAAEKFVVSDAQATQDVRRAIDIGASLVNMIPGHDMWTFRSLYHAMLLSNSPQTLMATGPTGSHTVLVYAINKLSDGTWQLDVYDSKDNSRNYPMIFDGSKFKDWQGCTPATLNTCEDHNYTEFTFVGSDAGGIAPSLEAIYNKYLTYNISGTITLNGSGLPGVTVSLGLGGTGSDSATTDANGRYSFAKVANGTYNISAAKFGYTLTPSNISTVVVNGADVTGQNFSASVVQGPVYSVSGTIHSQSNTGPALSGATVSIGAHTATTSPTGTFTVSGISAGRYALTVAKAGYITYTNAAFGVSSDMVNQSFYLLQPISTFSVTGTIHSASNSGPVLPGATVSFTMAGKAPAVATSDSAGVFTISGLQAGTYVLTIAKSGYDPYVNSTYSIASSQSGVTKYLTSSATYSMSGIIHAFDNSGMGLPGATVSLTAAGKSPITDTTDSNGAFLLTGIPAGMYVFTVSRFGWTTFTNPAYSISANQGAKSFFLTAAPPFGVLAVNSTTGAAGLSWGYSTVDDAKVRALSECGVGCSAVIGYAQGTCVSFARGPASYAYSVKETHSPATTEAINSCNTVFPGCVEILWGCN